MTSPEGEGGYQSKGGFNIGAGGDHAPPLFFSQILVFFSG